MGTILNIRGTNGAGKTTLARAFLPPNMNGDADGGPVDLNWYASPTKKDPTRLLRVEGYVREMFASPAAEPVTVGIVGPYKTATGGLDNVPSFGVQQEAIRYMLGLPSVSENPSATTSVFNTHPCDFVIAEGVLASTVYGSWGEFALEMRDASPRAHFAFVYLQTPLEQCFANIRKRQEASGKVKPIKEDLVADKFKAIAATRKKALEMGQLVYDLPVGIEVHALTEIIAGNGDHYLAHA